MYRILHILTGEFIYRIESTPSRSTYAIIGSRYRNMHGWSCLYPTYKDAYNDIIKIAKDEFIFYYVANGITDTITEPGAAEYEIIEV